MTRRDYLRNTVTAIFSIILTTCTKKVGIIPKEKQLILLKIEPNNPIANDSLKVFWDSKNIKFISIYTKFGNADWVLNEQNLNASLAEYTLIMPAVFPSNGSLSVKLTGDNIDAIKNNMPTKNAYIVDTITHPELAVVGGIKSINIYGIDVFVKRETSSGIKCFSSACTHSGCPLSYLQVSNKFNCSCHGSQFDVNGNVLMGPANLPLNTFVCETLAPEKFRIFY
jgi:Rieske Fe-S protein